MRVIDLTSEEKDKYENSEVSEEEIIEQKQESDGLDAFSVESVKREKEALDEAHERVNNSYSLFLQKQKNGTNDNEDDIPKYIELKNPAGDIKPINKLPEDDPFKTSEEDATLKATTEKKINVSTYANPFTYKGGVPGFLPNSPTRVPRNQLSSYNKSDLNTNAKRLNREMNLWNWGAFQFTWFWAFFNTKWWIGLIFLLIEPKIIYWLTEVYVSLIGSQIVGKLKSMDSLSAMDFILVISIPLVIRLLYSTLWGFFGNRISWFVKAWGTIDNYKASQEPWRLASLVVFGISALICLTCFIASDIKSLELLVPTIVYITLALLTIFTR